MESTCFVANSGANRWPIQRLLIIVGLAAFYFVAGKVGLRFAMVHPSATAIWAPAGITLAGFLLLGYWVWPAFAVGAFLVNAMTAGSLLTSLAIATGNTLEGLLGAYLVNRFASGQNVLDRTQNALRFFVLAALLSTTVAATIGVSSLCLSGFARSSEYGRVWLTWWLGDATGDLIVAPFLLLWGVNPRIRWSRQQTLEAVALLLLVVLSGTIAFGGPIPLARSFVCMPALLWIAFRFGPREVSAATLFLSAIAVVVTLNGLGPSVQSSRNEILLLLQSFAGVLGLISLVVATEVSGRRRLDDIHARLAAIVDSSDEAIIAKTLEGRITSWNASAERIFGFSAAEAIGQPITIVIPPERLDEETSVLARLRSGQAISHFETERVHKDGHRMEISLSISPIRGADDRIIGASTIARDITDQKRAQLEREELLRSEQIALANTEAALSKLRRLQILTDTTLSHSTQEQMLPALLTRIRSTLAADVATVLLLSSDGEHLQSVCSVGLSERAGEGTQIPVSQGAEGRILTSEGGLILNDLVKTETPSSLGRQQIESLVGAPLKSRDHVIGVLEVGSTTPRQFTPEDLELIHLVAERAALAIERTQLHRSEQLAREAAESANRAKDEFLSVLGHELRNPLAAISMSGHLLGQMNGRPEQVNKAQSIIVRQAEQLSRLVDDLLDVSRVATGRIALHRRPVSVADCVADCVAQLALTEQMEHHRVTVEGESVWIDGDPDRLVQIVTNLLSNAAKYSPAGSEIVVRVGEDDGYAVVTVKDEGIGISEDLLPRIFDLFVQGQRSLDHSKGGLGIGLALVLRLVELHGGQVNASSEGPGRGSTFVVRLPRISPPGGIEGRKSESGEPDVPRRILVIEDNADARQSLLAFLELARHKVCEADDGLKGLEMAKAFQPEVALIDVGLPGIDGYEVARRLRCLPQGQEMVLIALTGFAQSEHRERAEEVGFDAYLVKPVNPAELRALLGSRYRAHLQ